MPQLLIETTAPSAFVMVEARKAPGSGKMVARGEFGRYGVPTANGRIYSESLMKREIKRLTEDLKSRRVLGELDHPSDGKTSLKRVSHVLTDLWLEADGRVMGEAEVLGTPEGKTLAALIEAKIPVGVSSRGFGSTKSVAGEVEGEEVQDDFILKTYDFVADPAVRTAIPGITMESVDDPTAAQLFLSDFPDVAKQIQEAAASDAVEKAKEKINAGLDAAVKAAEDRVRSEMTEAFEKRLAEALVEAREDIGIQLREEYAADPKIGEARAMLAQIAEMVGAYRQHPDEAAVRDALKAKEIEVSEAVGERDEAIATAHDVAMRLHVERQIGSHPMAESVRTLLRGVKMTSVADANEKLAAIMEHLPKPDPVEAGPSEEEVRLREENATLRGTLQVLESKVDVLDEKLKRAVELGQSANGQLREAEVRAEEAESKLASLGSELHEARLAAAKATKVAGLPNARNVLGLLENVESEAEIDNVVRRYGATEISDGQLRDMRRSLQRGRGADNRENLTEDRRSVGGADDINEFGTSIHVMRKLAGYKD